MDNSRSTKKIGLLGPWGFGNLGDAAIQQAMIEHIKTYFANVQIYGFSLIPEDTQKRHGIRSFPLGRMPGNSKSLLGKLPARLQYHPFIILVQRIFVRAPLELFLLVRSFKHLEGFDLLIVSGGGQLDDSGGGAWDHPYTLFKWAVIAKIRKAKLMVVSVGAGPIDAALSRYFIKHALSLASYRSFRDENSKKLIAEIGFKADDPVYPDLAYSLQVATEQMSCTSRESQRVVGISPMAYYRPGSWPMGDTDIYWSYLTKLASFISWLIQKNYTIRFIPSHTRFDPPVIRDLQSVLKHNGQSSPETQITEPSILTVDDLVAHISTTDMVVASRLHSILLAQLINKPVLALSYHDKDDSLMADMGQAEYCLSIERFDVNALIERFTALEANREVIKRQLEKKVQAYRTALCEQYELIFSNS